MKRSSIIFMTFILMATAAGCGGTTAVGAATAPPVDLPAPVVGRIDVGTPDATGKSTITGTPGAVEADTIVMAINENLEVASALWKVTDALFPAAYAQSLPSVCSETGHACTTSASDGSFELQIDASIGDSIIIVLLDEEGQRRVVAETAVVAPVGDEIAPLLDEVVEKRAPILRYTPEGAAELGQLSQLCVPLIAQAKLVGLIYTDLSGIYGRFTMHDRDLLTALANQAAVALENASWADTLERRVEEFLRKAPLDGVRPEANRTFEQALVHGAMSRSGIVDADLDRRDEGARGPGFLLNQQSQHLLDRRLVHATQGHRVEGDEDGEAALDAKPEAQEGASDGRVPHQDPESLTDVLAAEQRVAEHAMVTGAEAGSQPQPQPRLPRQRLCVLVDAPLLFGGDECVPVAE